MAAVYLGFLMSTVMAESSTNQLGDPAADSGILKLWSDGSHEESTRRLLDEHGGRARAAPRRRFPAVHDEHLLLEAIHDAARSVFKAYDPAKGCSLGGWLLFIAGRRLCDLLRGERLRMRKTVPLRRGVACDDRCSPEQGVLGEEFHSAVHRAMSQLSELELRRQSRRTSTQANRPVPAFWRRRLRTTEQSIYAARARAGKKLLESPWMKPLYRSTG